MPAGGRNSYNPEDDMLLAKYIAQYAPLTGRKGNNLYKQLTEDVAKLWPWSSRHSWQSWRDRYVKNSYEFDTRIAKLQKRAQAAGPPNQANQASNAPSDNDTEADDATDLQRKRKKTSKTLAAESKKAGKRRRIDTETPSETRPAKKSTTAAKQQEKVAGGSKPVRQNRAQTPAPPTQPVMTATRGNTADSQLSRDVPEDRGEGPSRLQAKLKPSQGPSKPPSNPTEESDDFLQQAKPSKPIPKTVIPAASRPGPNHTVPRPISLPPSSEEEDEESPPRRVLRSASRRSASKASHRSVPQPFPVQPTSEADENDDDEETTPRRRQPAGSDDYSQQLFPNEHLGENEAVVAEGLEDAEEMDLDPEADVDEDTEVDRMLTDPIDIDPDLLDESQTDNLYPSIKSAQAVASTSKAPMPGSLPTESPLPTTSDKRYRNPKFVPVNLASYGLKPKPSQVVAAPLFDSSRPTTPNATSSNMRANTPEPTPRPIPKLVEGSFGGPRFKQPVRRAARRPGSSSSDSETDRPKAVWPPARLRKKKDASPQQPPPQLPRNARPNSHTASSPRVIVPDSERDVDVEMDSVHSSASDADEMSIPDARAKSSRRLQKGKGRQMSDNDASTLRPHRAETEEESLRNESPTRSTRERSRKGKHRQILLSDDDEDDDMDTLKADEQEHVEVESPDTVMPQAGSSRIQERPADDGEDGEEEEEEHVEEDEEEGDEEHGLADDEPLFTQPSQQYPAVVPESSQVDEEASTRPPSSDEEHADYNGPLFTQPQTQPFPESQPPHTPSFLPNQSISSGALGSRPLVSDESARLVMKALSVFLDELDETRRTVEREKQEVSHRASAAGSAELLSPRARGSPVRKLNGRESSSSFRVVDEGIRRRSSAGSSTLAPHSSPKARSQRRGGVTFETAEQGLDDSLQDDNVPPVAAPNGKRKKIHSLSKLTDRSLPTQPVASSSRHVLDEDASFANTSMHSIFSASSSSPARNLNHRAPDLTKGKRKASLPPSSPLRDDDLSPEQSARSKQHPKVDLREVARAQADNKRRSSIPSHASVSSATSSVARAASSVSAESMSQESPAKLLSKSDQARVLDYFLQGMANEYGFGLEYVRTVWKRAGDLDVAAQILAQIRDYTNDLLSKATEAKARGSSSVAGSRSSPADPPLARGSSVAQHSQRRTEREVSDTHANGTNGTAIPAARAQSTARGSSARGSSPHRKSKRPSDTFTPMLVDGPAPEHEYSPPTHSRAGQVVLLREQGREGEAVLREQRRATRGEGAFRYRRTNGASGIHVHAEASPSRTSTRDRDTVDIPMKEQPRTRGSGSGRGPAVKSPPNPEELDYLFHTFSTPGRKEKLKKLKESYGNEFQFDQAVQSLAKLVK